MNTFTGQLASAKQSHDMLNFREISERASQLYIKHYLLGQPSGSTTIHRKKLLTMSSQLPKRKRKSHQEKESEIVIKSLRRHLAWCNRNGQQFNEPEQYSIFPRALADANGMPHKSAKSSWTDKLKSTYCTHLPAVFSHTIQREFIPQVVIIDAMFLLNTKPLCSIKILDTFQNIFNVVC